MTRFRRGFFTPLALMLALTLAVSACGGQSGSTSGSSGSSTNQAGQQPQASEPKDEYANFPEKEITVVVNTKAGSSVDVMARTIAKVAEKYLGQPVVVLNKPGGDGAVAMSYVLGQPADGYHIWAGTKTLSAALNTNLKQFKVSDFQPLVRVQVDPFALGVRAEAPWQSLRDLIEDAKANPGKIQVGGFGSASAHSLAAYRLMYRSGAEFTWVPFDAGSEAMTAVLGGHVDVVHSNPSTLQQHVESGKLRILAVAADERLADFPDVPTYKEEGVDMVDSQWRGLFLKAGTPEPIVEKLHEAFKQAIKDPEFQEYLKNTKQIDGYLGPDDFTAFVEEDVEAAKEIIERVGLGQ